MLEQIRTHPPIECVSRGIIEIDKRKAARQRMSSFLKSFGKWQVGIELAPAGDV